MGKCLRLGISLLWLAEHHWKGSQVVTMPGHMIDRFKSQSTVAHTYVFRTKTPLAVSIWQARVPQQPGDCSPFPSIQEVERRNHSSLSEIGTAFHRVFWLCSVLYERYHQISKRSLMDSDVEPCKKHSACSFFQRPMRSLCLLRLYSS